MKPLLVCIGVTMAMWILAGAGNSRPVQLEELEEKGKTLEAKVTSLETLEGKGEAYGSGSTEYRFYLRHEGKTK